MTFFGGERILETLWLHRTLSRLLQFHFPFHKCILFTSVFADNPSFHLNTRPLKDTRDSLKHLDMYMFLIVLMIANVSLSNSHHHCFACR